MYKIQQSSYFIKKAKKLVKKNREIAIIIATAIENLSQNPKNPIFNSHKVTTPKFGLSISSRITADLRIIWRYNEKNQIEIIELLDIGGYSGSNKVYN